MYRLAIPHIWGAFRLDDIHGNLQSWRTIDATLTTMVVFVGGVQGDDFVAEKTCCFRASMGNQGLFLGKLQLEVISQERSQFVLDFLGFFLGNLMSFPILLTIPFVPIEARALIKRVLAYRHDSSMR